MLASTIILHETNEIFDNAMAEAANVVLAFSPGVEPDSAGDAERMERLALSGDRRKYMSFQIRDATGQVVQRSSTAPVEPYPAPLKSGYFGRGTIRYLTRALPANGGYVQIAEFYDERRDSFLGLVMGFLVSLLAMMGLGGALLSRGIGRVGRSIASLGGHLQARSGSNLSSIDEVDLPMELKPIVHDVNRLLERLSTALDAERAFSANCAHELRNPIASARAQAEYITRFPEDGSNGQRVQALEGSLRQLGHRIERLLQLSRAEVGVGFASPAADAVAVARLVVEEYRRRGDDIVLDAGSDAALPVIIDTDAIGIALQNLIDNALANAAPGTAVEVAIRRPGSVHIVNDGVCVPAEKLAGLMQRFARDSEAKRGGYGLGLAIVGALMRQTGGQLELHSPAIGRASGFEAVMVLPAATSAPSAD